MTQGAEQPAPSADPEVLGRLLAAHTVLQRLPSKRTILQFVTRALRTVPGVLASAASLPAEELRLFDGEWGEAGARLADLEQATPAGGYLWHSTPTGCVLAVDLGSLEQASGCLYLLVDDRSDLETYLPFLTNLAGSVALSLSRLQQRVTIEKINEELRARERDYERLFQEMASGFAVHELIVDEEGVPVDYRFLTVNRAFEELTGLRAEDIIGRTALEVLPGLEQSWIDTYGKVALAGKYFRFENYSATLERHYEVVAYSPSPGRFATIFNDVTERLKREDDLRLQAAEMEAAYRREHEVAEHLQKALLPELPDVPGLEVDVVYESATDLSRVGGDFYDLVPLGDERVMIVVGDVCGKGVPAAKRMAMVRHTLRAMAADDLPANVWLAEANRRLTAVENISDFVTVALVVLDMRQGILEYSLAGHPPPFLACSEGVCVLDSVVALPLGAAEEAQYGVARLPIHPGDVLLLYTDGLSEARHGGRQFGFDSLPKRALTIRDQPLRGAARRLVESARSFSQGELHDDTVVVLLRLSPC